MLGMARAFRWIGVTLGCLILVAIAAFVIARMRGPSEEEKAALALLEEPAAPVGQNAFAALWLMPYPVPEAELEAVLAEDVRRFSQRPIVSQAEADALPAFTSIAGKQYPADSEPDRARYCKWRSGDCLSKVRAEPEAYARLLGADAALLARATAISRYGHVRSPFPQRMDVPFPSYHHLSLPLTRHAYSFVTGDADAALNGACRDISTARMLIVHGDNLISSMIGAAMLQGNVGLLADMLAELPTEHPLPSSCTTALAPAPSDEFSACPAMRREARLVFGSMREINSSDNPTGKAWQAPLFPIFYDHDKTVARMAPRLAWYCGKEAESAIAADLSVQASPASGASFACVDNFIGCVLADAGDASFDEYQHRLQDAGLRLKVMSTIVWLRDQPRDKSTAARLARRPQSMRSPAREVRISEDGTSLEIDLFDDRDGPTWQLPLPASRLPVATTSL